MALSDVDLTVNLYTEGDKFFDLLKAAIRDWQGDGGMNGNEPVMPWNSTVAAWRPCAPTWKKPGPGPKGDSSPNRTSAS